MKQQDEGETAKDLSKTRHAAQTGMSRGACQITAVASEKAEEVQLVVLLPGCGVRLGSKQPFLPTSTARQHHHPNLPPIPQLRFSMG